MSGSSYTLQTQINIKGYTFHTLALGDTGANGFLFINSELATLLIRYCGARSKPLPCAISVTGYNGQGKSSISHYVRLTLQIDNRRFVRMPFCIAPLGNHDVIIGRKWFEYFKVDLAIADRKLLWPQSLPPTYFFDKLIKVTRESMAPRRVDPFDQADAKRRDRALDKQIKQTTGPATSTAHVTAISPAPKQRTLWTPTLGRHNYDDEQRRTLRNMDATLAGTFQPTLLKHSRKSSSVSTLSAKAPKIDLLEISAVAYDLLSKKTGHNAFVTTLDELDSLISNGQEMDQAARTTLCEIDYSDDEHLVNDRLAQFPQYAQFKDVFNKQASDELPPHRVAVDHKIELEKENTLSYSPLYRMTTEELLAVKEYLLDNLHKGFIVPSSSPFASPVLFVAKPNGSLRFCVDYRKLNSLTKKDQHPLPLIDETLARIAKAKVFTKLDIRQAFYRIRMDPASEELTTFRTRYGTYKYRVLPFGLTNGPATYQRYMNEVLFEHLDDFCTAYLDDILIYSDNLLEHENHVKLVLERLRAAGLQVDIKKTELHVTRTKYLGFIISTQGLEVDPEKIAAVTNWQLPDSVKGVQSFLGFCNFYRRFIQDYGRIAKPLNELTRKDTTFRFTDDCETAFVRLQELLTTAPLLAHYNPALPTQVETDASDGVIAGVLSQEHPGSVWKPVGYFSKTMTPAELNYQVHDKELLAIVKSLQQWRADLARTNTVVRVWTDHKALEYFMTTKQLNQRQARWAEVLAEFYFSITYRPGSKNVLADTLTRREQDTGPQDALGKAHRTQVLLTPDKLDPRITQQLHTELAPVAAPNTAPELVLDGHTPLDLIDQILTANKQSLSLDDERAKAARGDQDWKIQGACLLYQDRLVVPEDENLRTKLLKFVHAALDTAHPGKTKTLQLLVPRYY
jgi:hypothetical protein